MPKSGAKRAKDYRQNQMETNETEYRTKSKFFSYQLQIFWKNKTIRGILIIFKIFFIFL